MCIVVHTLPDLACLHPLRSEGVHAFTVRRSPADLEGEHVPVHVDSVLTNGDQRPPRHMRRVMLVAKHDLGLCDLQVADVYDPASVVYVPHVEGLSGERGDAWFTNVTAVVGSSHHNCHQMLGNFGEHNEYVYIA